MRGERRDVARRGILAASALIGENNLTRYCNRVQRGNGDDDPWVTLPN
jgi:hypothetical protein